MHPSPAGWLPLHGAPATSPNLGFAALLALAGIGSAAVLGLALAALVRRRSRSYLLVTLALATLLARTGVAALSLAGSMDAAVHHWLEHGLDAAMAALVVAAVYDARAVRRSSGGDGNSGRSPADGADSAWSSEGDAAPEQSIRSDGGGDPGQQNDDARRDGRRPDAESVDRRRRDEP